MKTKKDTRNKVLGILASIPGRVLVIGAYDASLDESRKALMMGGSKRRARWWRNHQGQPDMRLSAMELAFERLMVERVPASGEWASCKSCGHLFAVRYVGEQVCQACRLK